MGSLASLELCLLLTFALCRKTLENNITVKRSLPRNMGEYNTYPDEGVIPPYENEVDKECYFTPCCKAKAPGVIKECFIVAPLLSGVLSFAVISKLVKLGSTVTGLCTSTTILMATTTGTIENFVTVTASTTMISTTTVLVPVTSTILTTAVIVQTKDVLSLAPLTIKTILITTSPIVRNTVSTIEIDRRICDKNGKRAAAEFPPPIIDADEPIRELEAILPSVPMTHQYHTEPAENGRGFVLLMYPKEVAGKFITNSMGYAIESSKPSPNDELQTPATPPLSR